MAMIPIYQLRNQKVYKERKFSLERDYRKLYRFDEANVTWIAEHFLGENYETRGGALSPTQKMRVFLRYVADPGFQTGVGEDIGIDQSTVSKTVNFVRQKILQKASSWIKFPSNGPEIAASKMKWQEKYRMPCVIGAIDCTHVRITKPAINGDEYINRKQFPSINVQATCDADEKFTSVNAEWPGSVHDSRIFKNSDIYAYLKGISNQGTTVLMGDSGYGIAPWIIVPYANPADDVQRNFNQVYAKDRVIIERCFGQVKRRFPTLHYKIRVATDRVSGMIVACFILHNVAKYLNDADDFEILPGGAVHEEQQIQEMRDAQIRERGQRVRQEIANTLYNNRRI